MAKRQCVDATATGTCDVLPLELVKIIWAHRAVLRLRKCAFAPLRAKWVNFAKRHQEGKDARRVLWTRLCEWLQDNKAVVAGSASVHALTGAEWQPTDLDIFVRKQDLGVAGIEALRLHVLAALPSRHTLAMRHAKVMQTWLSSRSTFMQGADGKVAYPMPLVTDLYDFRLNPTDKQSFIQVVVLDDNGIGTPFYDSRQLYQMPLRRILYECFDVKMCASAFDGRDFHIVDWLYMIRGMSCLEPCRWRAKRGAESRAGQSPLTKRPYQVAVHAEINRERRWFSANPSFALNTYQVLVEWAKANELDDRDTLAHELDRICKYLNRGLVLTLGMHYVADPKRASMRIVHANGDCRSFADLAWLLENVNNQSKFYY